MTDITHWNYRVMKVREDCFTIREVYYNGDKSVAYTDEVEPYGDSFEELQADLEHMLEALSKPVLTEKDFGK